MSRHLPFSYRCGRCGRCCSDMRIQLNPYEVLRLARRLGQGSTRFLAAHTLSGVLLKPRPDGACGLLSAGDCTVHPDRPLVCRLYPLARHVNTAGAERFACLLPRPGSAGEYGCDGSLEAFLEANQTGPFLAQADAWLALFARAWRLFEALLCADSLLAALASDIRLLLLDGHPPPQSRLLDPDPVAGAHCAARGLVLPGDPEEKTALHREALGLWLDGLGQGPETDHGRSESLARLVAALGQGLGVNMAALLQDASDNPPPGAAERDEALRLGAEFL